MNACDRSSPRLALGAAVLWASVLTVSGCQSIGAASGAVAAVATGAATANPGIGIGVGIAVQAAADEAVKRTMRGLHQDQQDAIAALAGAMPVGDTRPWRVKHDVYGIPLPVESGHGQIRVLRAFATPLAICKEFVFSVAGGDAAGAHEDWFTASACQQAQGWKWASAEPAVARWGNLQ